MNAKSFQAVTLVGTALACFQVCYADDLLTSYRNARETDPVFLAVRHQSASVTERLVQADAALGPTVNLNANVNRQVGEASFNAAEYASRSVRTTGWTLALAQPVWRAGARVAREQAVLQVQQSEQVLRQASSDLILRVAQAYFEALVARETAEVANSQVRAVEQQLELAKRQYEAGLTTITDLHEARSRFELARAQRTSASTDLETRNAELEKVLGYAPKRIATLKSEAKGPAPEPPVVQHWIDQAHLYNPQVQAQQLALAVANQEVRKATAAHNPSLDLTAAYGNNFTSGSMTSPTELASRVRSGQVGLQLSVPLYTNGASQSRVREALLLRDKAQAELDATYRQITAQMRQTFTSLVNGQAQIQSLAAASIASQSAVDANKIGYQIGTRINIDVLNAQQQLFSTQRDLFRVRVDTVVQTLRLKATAGTLDESDLLEMNALLRDE